MEYIWWEYWKNFLPKPEMFPAYKHLFPEALAPSVDEMASVCRRVEERFTGIQMDIGKLEMELLKAWDWSARAQDQIDRLETHLSVGGK